MSWLRSGAGFPAVIALVLALGSPATHVAAQAPTNAALPYKSVRGKLERVDTSQNSVTMKSDAGARQVWRFDPSVIKEAAQFEPGAPMVVIYRQLGPTEKAVTALAFPGAASTPIYINTTSARVVMRSGPAVDGKCGGGNAGPINESAIPGGGLTEIADACWCCAPAGETCNPANKSGPGRALLVQCFK